MVRLTILLLLPAALTVVTTPGCSTTEEGRPLSPEEQADLRNRSEAGAPPMDETAFFVEIDSALKTWDLLVNQRVQDLETVRKRQLVEGRLAELVKKGRELLLVEAQVTSPHRRPIALAALGFSRDREVLPILIDALSSPDEPAVQNALLSLAMLDDASTPLDPLTELLLTFPTAGVRRNAARVLLKVAQEGDRETLIPKLLTALEDPDEVVRATTAKLLGRLAAEEAVGNLILALNDGFPLVQVSAIEALARIDNPLAIDSIIEKLDSGDPEVQLAAQRALKALSDGRQFRTKAEWLEWWDIQRPALIEEHVKSAKEDATRND